MATNAKTAASKPKRKFFTLKNQVIVVAAVGAVAWASRFLYKKAKRAATP